MAVVPIIHCLVDREPVQFHQSDVDGKTATFAVNLAFEARSDGLSGDLVADEKEGEELFAAFLHHASQIAFHAWRAYPPLDHPGIDGEAAIETVSDPSGAEPDLLLDWLRRHQSVKADRLRRFWTTLVPPGGTVDAVQTANAEDTDAFLTLRAAQSWNAPVAHRFGLTHLVRIGQDTLDQRLAIVPYFAPAEVKPPEAVATILDPANPDPADPDTLFEFEYDTGEIGRGRCRLNLVTSLVADPLAPPSQIDPKSDVFGYVEPRRDGEAVYRLLTHFEMRCAAFLAAGNALAIADREDALELEALFGVTYPGPDAAEAHWGAALWLVAARLISALDMILIALLKPTDEQGEGDVLAPFVSAILDNTQGRKGSEVVQAIRRVFQNNSALSSAKPKLLDRTLRHVFQIEPTRKDGVLVVKPGDLRERILGVMIEQIQDLVDGTLADDRVAVADGTTGDLKEKLTKALNALLAPGFIAHLVQQLDALEGKLQEEAGAEQALIRLFEATEFYEEGTKPEADRKIAYRIAAELAGGVPDGTLVAGIETAWTDYRKLLEGPFNGAEAVRRAAGTTFAKQWIRSAEALGAVTVDEALTLLADSDYYQARLVGPAGGVFDPLLAAKPSPLRSIDGHYRPDDLKSRLTESFRRAVAPLRALSTSDGRFVTDSFPLPLPIQIATGIDGTRLDTFLRAFNGIGVAIRRRDSEGSAWSHTNLAELIWPVQGNDPTESENGALHPMLPAISDARAPMFITYDGLPFADAPALDADDRQPPPFYAHRPYDFERDVYVFEPTARLAYGRTFETVSFLSTNAGTLPRALQRANDRPWMPYPQIAFDGNDPATGNPWDVPKPLEFHCQRRTAIAQMAVIEQPGPAAKRRLGEGIAGVFPLCLDYPRRALVASDRLAGALDLFRDSDGHGQLDLSGPPDAIAEWPITDIRTAGGAGQLAFAMFDRAASGPDAVGFASFGAVIAIPAGDRSLGDLTLRAEPAAAGRRTLSLVQAGTVIAHVDIDASERMCWLRMSLTAAGAAPVSVTIADPDGRRAAGASAPLLLQAPDSPTWKRGHSATVRLRASTPRVGYADFIRWMANVDLRARAYAGAIEDQIDAFHEVLAIAVRMRDLDAELGQYLDKLPDPAVALIHCELVATDGFGDVADPCEPRQFSFRDALSRFVRATRFEPDTANGLWTPRLIIKKVLAPLDELFGFAIAIAPGNALALSAAGATVPAGCVAELTMHALVERAHFRGDGTHPSVFDDGYLQYAAREDANCVAFPASALRIETMYEGITALAKDGRARAIDLAEAMIEAVPVANTRRFDLMSKGAGDRPMWRLIAEVDVATQRWRPSGRPIYHFIAPRDHALAPGESANPALPLQPKPDAAMALFEREAFFDRPDIDAHSVTQRLEPMPSRTVLQEHPWDDPSATYYRHRFTLRSRYAGALKDDREVPAWPVEPMGTRNPGKAWTMRVAMLADHSKLTLTRPQLRAMIPLTAAPGGEVLRQPAPPVAAILQEPPFARGGLADRIAAEIKTGFGYGFAAADVPGGIVPVEILDSRKESGPNPHITYRPFAEDQVLGLALRGEGPIGLTFDLPEAPAPAFPNAMMLLRPLSFCGDEPPLQESLMAVAMRRYIDPAWLTGGGVVLPQAPETVSLDMARCWWIELPDFTGTISYALEDGGAVVEVAHVVRKDRGGGEGGAKAAGDRVSVWVRKAAIDLVAGHVEKEVETARIEADKISRLMVLHQEVAPGHYATSILAQPHGSRTDLGDGDTPLVLCGFEWKVPREAADASDRVNAGRENAAAADEKPFRPKLIVAASGAQFKARETMASAPTAMKWTQVSRDFDFVHTMTGEALVTQVAAAALTAQLGDDGGLSFRVAGARDDASLCPSTEFNPHSSHLVRHLAAISTYRLEGLGRPLEMYSRAVMLARGLPSLAADLGVRDEALRIVEFETPASIICAQGALAPPQYLSAYIDLVSSGYQAGSQLLFRFRFVTRLPANADTVVLQFSQPATVAAASHVELVCPLVRTRKPVGLYVVANGNDLNAWVDYADGKTSDQVHQAHVLDLRGVSPGLFVGIKEMPSGDELWAEVSCLHGPPDTLPGDNTRSLAFDPNWLFSPRQTGDPAMLVSPIGLATMVEAQARIVTVSPPIPIVRSGQQRFAHAVASELPAYGIDET